MALSTRPTKAELAAHERAFIEEYCRTLNGTRAAILAGYSKKTAASKASQLLRKVKIRQSIEERFKAYGMGTNEILARLAVMARGDLSPFLAEDGSIDWINEEAKSNIYLLKKARIKNGVTKSGEPWEEREVELHDPQSALVHLGRHSKLFTDKIELDDSKFKEYQQALKSFIENGRPPDGAADLNSGGSQ